MPVRESARGLVAIRSAKLLRCPGWLIVASSTLKYSESTKQRIALPTRLSH
jgi:hypothetical protein